jgi:hypothetical protein
LIRLPGCKKFLGTQVGVNRNIPPPKSIALSNTAAILSPDIIFERLIEIVLLRFKLSITQKASSGGARTGRVDRYRIIQAPSNKADGAKTSQI